MSPPSGWAVPLADAYGHGYDADHQISGAVVRHDLLGLSQTQFGKSDLPAGRKSWWLTLTLHLRAGSSALLSIPYPGVTPPYKGNILSFYGHDFIYGTALPNTHLLTAQANAHAATARFESLFSKKYVRALTPADRCVVHRFPAINRWRGRAHEAIL